MMKNKFEIGEKVLIINPGHNYPSDVFAQRLFSDKLEYFQGISIGGYGRVNNNHYWEDYVFEIVDLLRSDAKWMYLIRRMFKPPIDFVISERGIRLHSGKIEHWSVRPIIEFTDNDFLI